MCQLRDSVCVISAGAEHLWQMPTVSVSFVITNIKKLCVEMVDVVYSGPSHELDLTNTDDDRFVQRATARSIRPQRAHDHTSVSRSPI